jgi:hypothetical protein
MSRERMVAVISNSLEKIFLSEAWPSKLQHCFFTSEIYFTVRRKIYPAEEGGSDKYFAAATAKAKIWRGPFAVWGFFACKWI